MINLMRKDYHFEADEKLILGGNLENNQPGTNIHLKPIVKKMRIEFKKEIRLLCEGYATEKANLA